MRRIGMLALVAGLAFAGAAAFAQDVAPAITTPGDTFIDFGSVIQNLLVTVVLPTMGAILSAVGIWVLTWIKTKTGLQVESSHAERLASWATNRAGEFLAKFDTIKGLKIDVGNSMIADLADTALTRIPDALAYFANKGQPIDRVALQKMIIQKIGILTASGTVPSGEVTITTEPGSPIRATPMRSG